MGVASRTKSVKRDKSYFPTVPKRSQWYLKLFYKKYLQYNKVVYIIICHLTWYGTNYSPCQDPLA